MNAMKSFIAAFLFCLVFLSPVLSHGAEQEDPFEHSSTQVPFSADFKADFQVNLEDMFVLTAADDPAGEGARKKLLSNLKALLGRGEDGGEDSGTAPDADITKRRPYFTKHGWQGYMEFVKQSQSILHNITAQYGMGNGIIIMSGEMDDKKSKFWLGPEEKDAIVYTGKGHVICRSMESVMCDTKFRIHIAFTPQDPDSFSDVVITNWLVEYLNDRDRPIYHD